MTRLSLPFLIASLFISASATAQQGAEPTGLDKASVEAHLNKVVAEKMAEHKVPGLIITIVEGDRVVLSKGYGHADVANKTPVDAQKTLFRVGSISKLVTATAFMRLTELDPEVTLSTDVRRLIAPIKLDLAHDAPLTPVHLLTHTSGYDVTDIGDASLSAEGATPLANLVAWRMTPQVHPPGRYHIYTNHGFALLGRLIETRRKMAFAHALKKDLFDPLGMTSSSFAQPPPDALEARLAIGHEHESGAYRALPLDYSNVSPADVLVTNGPDMGRFMIEHLRLYEGGAKSGLLEPETLEVMHKRHFGFHDQLDGHALGFWEERLKGSGHRVIAHTGGQLGFTSKMTLVPELGLGVFICTNRRVGKMRREVVESFMETFYPSEPAKAPEAASDTADLSRFVGDYLGVTYPTHSVEKIILLISPDTLVSVTLEDGTLNAGRFKTLTPLGGNLFYSPEKSVKVAFGQDKAGQVTDFYVDTRAYRRLSWTEHPLTSQRVMLATILLGLIGLFAWPFEGRRRRKKNPEHAPTKAATVAKVTVWLTCLLIVVFTVWLAVEIASAAGVGWDYGLPASLSALLHVPYLLTLLTATLLVMAAMAWRGGFWGPVWRGFFTLTALVLVPFLMALLQWNLFGS